ncbi:MAG: hypothetical protein O2968_20395 [Acidobacteria bacterium]|nr:hypothetical protein [Acidobacteriota bacterium]
MPKTVDFRLLILATLFGFLGGALSSIAVPQPAFAQDEPADRIVAREFHVVDGRGKTIGVFGARPALPPFSAQTDEQRNVREEPQPGAGRIMLFNSDSQMTWYAPPPEEPLARPLGSGTNR